MTQQYLCSTPDISEGISADSSASPTKSLSLFGEVAPELSDVAAYAPCSLSFVDVYHPDEDELDLSEEARHGFGMRRSELNPTEFHLFWERFIKFWPQRTFHVKRSYLTGFCEMKRKNGKSLPLFPALAVEYAERHLCHDYWGMWKSVQAGQHVPSSPIWLALHMPKKTTVDAIDFDAKQYQVGWYGKGWDERPLVHLPLEHFQTLKRLYDAFPERMWCISSETLGMHAWRVHDRPLDSLLLHERNKRVLASIGHPGIESHPMSGRCFRRPFGYDYRLITPTDVLDCWLYQVEYFEFDRRTPSFQQICNALIDAMLAQQGNWNSASKKGQSRGKLCDVPKQVPHLREIRDWLAAGCPLSPVVAVSVPEMIVLPKTGVERALEEVYFEATGEMGTITPTTAAALPAFSPDSKTINWRPAISTLSYRNGQWPKALRTWAKNGLLEPDSVGTVIHEMAKWLYWIELFEKPESERKKEICGLLNTFVLSKHNGFISRLLAGKEREVKKQVKRCVDSAISLQPKDKDYSLNLFATIRKNLEQGKYKYPLRLVPILTGEKKDDKHTSSSFLSISFMCIRFAPESLPQAILEKIRAKAGRKKLLPFAAKLMSYLVEHKGSAFIGRPLFYKLLGYENPTRLTEYLKVLEEADVISRGTSYSPGRNPKKCSLSSWAIKELTGQDPSEARNNENLQATVLPVEVESVSSSPEPPDSFLRHSIKSGGTEDQLASSDLIESILGRIEPALDCLR